MNSQVTQKAIFSEDQDDYEDKQWRLYFFGKDKSTSKITRNDSFQLLKSENH